MTAAPGKVTRAVRTVPAKGLLPGAVAILETDSGIVKGKRLTRQSLIVYQAQGDVLSAVYVSGNSLVAVQRLGLHIAAVSAAKLRKDVPVGDVR